MKVLILTSAFVTAMTGQASIIGGPNGSIEYFNASYYNGNAVCPLWEAIYFPTQFAAAAPFDTLDIPLLDSQVQQTNLAYTVPVTSSSDTITITIPAGRQLSGFDVNPATDSARIALYTAAGVQFVPADTYKQGRVTPVTLDEAFSNTVATTVKAIRSAGTGSVRINFKIW